MPAGLPIATTLEAAWLGCLDYDAAWELQNKLAGEIAAGSRPPTLLLLEHPHTYTLGRRGEAAHVLLDEAGLAAQGITLRWVDRGGDVTYHGPGQLVGYPLLRLGAVQALDGRVPQVDYVGYVRKLEQALILALAGLGVAARTRDGLTGVWVENAKIASIGVKVDGRGVTRHGFALNVVPDMQYWQGIIPCGLQGVRMTCLAELMPDPPGVREIGVRCAQALGEVLGYEVVFTNLLHQL